MVTQKMLRTCEGNQVFSSTKFNFATAVDLNKYLDKIIDFTPHMRTYLRVTS